MGTFRPGKPRWKMSAAGGQSLPIAETTVAFATTTWSEGVITLSSTTATIVVAGLYLCRANLVAHSAGTNKNLRLRLKLNGVTLSEAFVPSTQSDASATVAAIEELVAGDVLTVTATIGVNAATVQIPPTTFSGVRIGPVRWTG